MDAAVPPIEHFRRLERMYAAAPINAFYRPTLRVDEGATELVIAVRPEFFHAAHAVHGSVYFKAMDDAAFFAVSSLVVDVFVLTASFNIYLTRPIAAGSLRCRGSVVHRSKTQFLAEAELCNDAGKLIGRGNGAFMRSAIPLSADLGYA
jgi:uncharacterized protein (TIGR00369 family)